MRNFAFPNFSSDFQVLEPSTKLINMSSPFNPPVVLTGLGVTLDFSCIYTKFECTNVRFVLVELLESYTTFLVLYYSEPWLLTRMGEIHTDATTFIYSIRCFVLRVWFPWCVTWYLMKLIGHKLNPCPFVPTFHKISESFSYKVPIHSCLENDAMRNSPSVWEVPENTLHDYF